MKLASTHTALPASELSLVGFALSDCVVAIEQPAARYLRAVHRTALELAISNCFGAELGGFWLLAEQVAELRRLPAYYPPNEAPDVARAVEAYLRAQLANLHTLRHAGTEPW
jgi:hypothetical protein